MLHTQNLFSGGSLNHAADYCGLCWLHCPREMALKCGRVAIDPNHRICCVSSSSKRQRGGFLCKSLLILAQSFKIRSMDCQSRCKVEKINISRKMTLSIWASSKLLKEIQLAVIWILIWDNYLPLIVKRY